MFILDLVIPIIEDVLYYLDVSWILRGSAADDTLCNIKHFGIHRIECFYIIWNFEKGFRAASCKKSTRKNKLIRKNKSTRTEIFRYKISVLVDLFFLINLFFSYWLLHEAALSLYFQPTVRCKDDYTHTANLFVIASFSFLFAPTTKSVYLIIIIIMNWIKTNISIVYVHLFKYTDEFIAINS